jgi:hypothetical protein
VKPLFIQLGHTFVVSVYVEFTLLQICAPLLHSKENGHEFLFICGESLRLGSKSFAKKCQWVPACMSTAPTPTAQVFVSITKVLEKSSNVSTRVVTKQFFNDMKAN